MSFYIFLFGSVHPLNYAALTIWRIMYFCAFVWFFLYISLALAKYFKIIIKSFPSWTHPVRSAHRAVWLWERLCWALRRRGTLRPGRSSVWCLSGRNTPWAWGYWCCSERVPRHPTPPPGARTVPGSVCGIAAVWRWCWQCCLWTDTQIRSQLVRKHSRSYQMASDDISSFKLLWNLTSVDLLNEKKKKIHLSF